MFEKPPLLYWMIMASYPVFGVNEFATRLGRRSVVVDGSIRLLDRIRC